jgi:hypothetical protein
VCLQPVSVPGRGIAACLEASATEVAGTVAEKTSPATGFGCRAWHFGLFRGVGD